MLLSFQYKNALLARQVLKTVRIIRLLPDAFYLYEAKVSSNSHRLMASYHRPRLSDSFLRLWVTGHGAQHSHFSNLLTTNHPRPKTR
jgi:hypothetical protein